GANHAADLGRVGHLHRIANPAQAQPAHRRLVALGLAVRALDERHFQGLGGGAGHGLQPTISSTRLPRLAAISSGDWIAVRAFMVARMTLMGLREPWLLASTLRTPAHSTTARMPAPAITPVPSAAGNMYTRVVP